VTYNAEDVRVWAAPDGSRAVIQYLPAAATRQDVEFALQAENVVAGIQWDNVDRALKEAAASQKAVQNVEVARAQATEPVFEFCGKPFDGREMEKLVAGLVDFGSALEGPDGRQAGEKSVFVCRGMTFLRIEQGEGGATIFGTPLNKAPLLRLLPADDASVGVRKYPNSSDYVAMINGYLACSRDKGFFIANPVVISPDRMRMDFVLAPVSSGKEELIDFFFDKRFEKASESISEVTPDRKEIAPIIDGDSVRIISLRRGRKPVPGRDGRLDLNIGAVQSEHTGDGKNNGKIDYRERTPFHEVAQGTIIAELTLSLMSSPGMDVLGKEIAVDPVHDIAFEAGENVTVVEKSGRLYYSSAIAGVAILTEDGVSVSPELKIQGDVGPETGNIHFGKNIIVEGIVTAGYTIVCGGDLEIHGNVENGAKIECKGRLTIRNGLFGQSTRCIVRGDANIGFLQNSVLRVGGNLTVDSYIYNSQVFCEGELLVRGARVTGEDRGAVIGGQVCSMKSMTVHSAGSPSVKTELLSGVDPDAQAALTQAKSAEPILARKIQTLQSSLGVNLQDPNAIEKLRSMPPAFRARLKERINELKKLIHNRDAIVSALPQLERKAFSPELEKLAISIKNQLVPDVAIRIGNAFTLRVQEGERLKFKVDEGRIVEIGG
jgi:uncharacterized protein (DUF342 family)